MGQIVMPVIDMETLCYWLSDIFKDYGWKRDASGTSMTEEEVHMGFHELLEQAPETVETLLQTQWQEQNGYTKEDRALLLYAVSIVGAGCTEIMGIVYGPDGTVWEHGTDRRSAHAKTDDTAGIRGDTETS